MARLYSSKYIVINEIEMLEIQSWGHYHQADFQLKGAQVFVQKWKINMNSLKCPPNTQSAFHVPCKKKLLKKNTTQ